MLWMKIKIRGTYLDVERLKEDDERDQWQNGKTAARQGKEGRGGGGGRGGNDMTHGKTQGRQRPEDRLENMKMALGEAFTHHGTMTARRRTMTAISTMEGRIR